MTPCRQNRPGRTLVSAIIAISLALLGTLFLGLSPAAATDDTTGTVDTNNIVIAPPGGNDNPSDKCSDNCRRINWCDDKASHGPESEVTLADEAPAVLLQNLRTNIPSCVHKPTIRYVCCVGSEQTHLKIMVTNPNPVGLKVRVNVDNDQPVIKLIGANGHETYEFSNVPSGPHKLHVGVWTGKAWCTFGKPIKVHCRPLPTPSSPSPSPSVSVSTSTSASPSSSDSTEPEPSESSSSSAAVPVNLHTSTPPALQQAGQSLPVTGSPVMLIVLGGLGLLALGGGLFFFSRRRRIRTIVE